METKRHGTGMVRRLDDLGRVIIPKELRSQLRLREGDPLEIFVCDDGSIIFKRYSPLASIHRDDAKACLDAIESLGITNIGIYDSAFAVRIHQEKDAKKLPSATPAAASTHDCAHGIERLESRREDDFYDFWIHPIRLQTLYGEKPAAYLIGTNPDQFASRPDLVSCVHAIVVMLEKVCNPV